MTKGFCLKCLLVVFVAGSLIVCSAAPSFAYFLDIEFFGGALADSNGTSFPENFVPDIDTQSWGPNPALQSMLNTEAPYYAVAAVDYEIDWDLPDWAQEETWLVDADVWIEGNVNGFEVDKAFETYGYELGTFAFADSGYTEAEVLGFLSSIPGEYYDPSIGGYYVDGDWHSGQIYAALEKDFLKIDTAELEFGGTINFYTEGDEPGDTIPEPMTMALFGSGLVGLIGIRRKK